MAEPIHSVHGVPIRLTEERWRHVSEEHTELAGLRDEVLAAVASPDRVVGGQAGERIAIREIERGKHLVVVNREQDDDGFVITAFLTRRTRWLQGREQLWP